MGKNVMTNTVILLPPQKKMAGKVMSPWVKSAIVLLDGSSQRRQTAF